MLKSSKRLLSLTLAVSVFAVVVSAISTYAWFQIDQVAVPNVDDAALVQSDSTNLAINNITGYKYKYNDVSYGVTDYEHGEPVSYEAASLENVDQADRKELDIPTDGEGFYIVGDASWVNDYNTKTGKTALANTAWSYASGLRMDDNLVAGNNDKATVNNIYLTAGTEFRIRHHTLTTYSTDQTQTEDYSSSWYSVTLVNENVAEIDGNNIVIKEGKSGYYNIYLNNSNQISFSAIANPAPSPLADLSAKKGNVERKARRETPATDGSSSKIYLDLSGIGSWSAKQVWIYWFGSGTTTQDIYSDNNKPQISTKYTTGEISVKANYTHIIVVVSWDDTNHSWGWQTADIPIADAKGNWLNIVQDGDKYTISPHTSTGYYIVGSGTVNSTSLTWPETSLTGSVKLEGSQSPNLGYQANVTFNANAIVRLIKVTNNRGAYSYVNWSSTWSDDVSSAMEVNDTNNRKAKRALKINVYVNKDEQAYLDIVEYSITFKYKRYPAGNSWGTAIDNDWQTISTFASSYTSAQHGASISRPTPSIQGYDSWDYWYTGSDFTGKWSSGTKSITSNTIYYGRCKEVANTLTIHVAYTTDGTMVKAGLGDDIQGLGTASLPGSASSSISLSDINTAASSLMSAADTYFDTYTRLSGYYETIADGTNIISGSLTTPIAGLTANKDIYIVYQPTRHTVTQHYVFYAINGTDLFGAGPSKSDTEHYAYETTAYSGVEPATTVTYWNSGTKMFYAFEVAGWYTGVDGSGKVTGSYSATELYDDTDLYAKMVPLSMSTIYVNTSSVSWSTPYVNIFEESGSDVSSNLFQLSSGTEKYTGSTFKFSIPQGYSFNITNNSTYDGNGNQTIDIGTASTATDQNGTQRGTCDFVWVISDTVSSGTDSGKHKFEWEQVVTYTVQKRYTNGTVIETLATKKDHAHKGTSYAAKTPTTLYGSSEFDGYTWTVNGWYISDAYSGTKYSTASITSDKQLYTYYTENAYTLTIQLVYTGEGNMNQASAGGTATAQMTVRDSKSKSELDTLAATLISGHTSTYARSGDYYSTKNGSTISGAISTIEVGDMTSDKTIYLVYQPISHTITYTYKFFENGSSTQVTGATNTVNGTSGTAYETSNYTPTNPSNTQTYMRTVAPDLKFYVFSFVGWYTNPECTTSYSAKKYTANGTLYAKMEALPMTELYVSTETTENWASGAWTSPYIQIKNATTSPTIDSERVSMASGKVFSSNNYIYKFSMPTTYYFNVRQGNTDYDADNQYKMTMDISLSTTDTHGNSKSETTNWVMISNNYNNLYFENNGNKNGGVWSASNVKAYLWDSNNTSDKNGNFPGVTMTHEGGGIFQTPLKGDWNYVIFSNNGSDSERITDKEITVGSNFYYYNGTKGEWEWKSYKGTRSFVWQVFYGIGDDDSYYLVGDSNFENGSGNTPWTFDSDNKMSTSGLPLSVIAKYENRQLTAGMEFQIWHFTSTNGRNGMYANKNNDAETNATLDKDGSNLVVKINVSGYFDIYVTDTVGREVMVIDRNNGSVLYFTYGSTTGSYTMGKSPNSSVNYWASYEQGFQVTDAMISSSTTGVYIGVVREFAGQKTGYGDNASSYSFLGTSANKTFDEKTFSCLKIEKAGFYSFYLTSSGTIKITSRPYTVNGSDVKTSGGDNGYYIIPYSTTYGNATYRNGLKMNVIKGESATTSEGNKNIANYSRYKATAGDKFIIKYFENNVTKYSPLEIAEDKVTSDCLAYEGDGVYRFKLDGVYNIFMYKTGDERRAISVARDSLSDFSRLNSIPSNADDTSKVKSANTTLILDITFTITTPVNMGISLSSIISGAGLSTYVLYGLFVDIDYSGASGSTATQRIYNYFRTSTPYGTLVAMRSNTTISASGTFANGQHHAYIVIDYDPSQVSSLPTGINNNFHFILRAIQPAAA